MPTPAIQNAIDTHAPNVDPTDYDTLIDTLTEAIDDLLDQREDALKRIDIDRSRTLQAETVRCRAARRWARAMLGMSATRSAA